MKTIILILSLILIFGNAFAQMSNNPISFSSTGGMLGLPIDANVSSGDAGNGGGGVQQNGRYMTFYSYGFYTEREELNRNEVPQLNSLLQLFNQFPYLSPQTKGDIAAKLTPTSKRKYYKVKKDRFTPEVRSRLIEEFSRVTNTSVENLALFAITDTNNKITYLLPEFYELTPIEQKAILFHEAYWLLHPKGNLLQVIDAEISFQAYLENTSSLKKLSRLIEHIGSTDDKIQAALKIDQERGSLEGLLSEDKLYLRDLLGEDMISCYDSSTGPVCKSFFQINLYELRVKYPHSFFLKLIEDYLVESKLNIYLDGSSDRDRLFLNSTYKNCKKDYLRNGYIILTQKIDIHHPYLKIHKKMSTNYLGKSNDKCAGADSTIYFLD